MKRNLKSIICLAVIFSMMMSLCLVGFGADFKSEKLNQLNVGDIVGLGAPINEVQIMGSDSEVRASDGANIFYGVISGPPATLVVYNLDTNVVEDTKILQVSDKEMAKVGYAVDLDKEGMLHIATQSNCQFFRYNTKTKELKGYGAVFEETAVMHRGYFDSEGNYYFGTYPSAKLVKYDKKADKIVDLGTMIESGKYVRSMGGYGDKIFMGGTGNPTTEFVKYDIKTKKATPAPMPEQKGVFTKDDVNTFYAISTAGKYLFARTKINGSVNGYILCVFDMEKEEWIDFIPKTLHMDFSDFYGDIVYFHNIIPDSSPAKAGLFTYNPATKEIKQIEGIDLKTSTYLIKPKLFELKDQEKYPGKTLVAASSNDAMVKINLETKKVEYVKSTLPGQATNIRTIKAGYNNDLILSAYMGAKVVFYDTDKEEVRAEAPSVQIEGINVFDDKYYFGLYGSGAALTEFDPKLPGKDKENPKQIGTLGKDQDRAFNVVDGGDVIVWGSYPNYGLLGGKVGVYDKKTKKYSAYAAPKNQCIAGLAYKNGKIYGSTSVYGGLGIDAIDAPAKFFIMDAKTGKIEKEVEIKLKSDTNKQYFVGDMIFDKDGKLWVASVRTLIELDPATLAIKQEISIGGGTHKIDKVRALPYHLRFDKDGLLYTNIGNRITAVDTKTSETKELVQASTNGIDIADNGNLYYMDTNINNINKLILTRGNEVVDKFDTVKKAGVMLKLDNTKAFVKGTETTLDVPAQTISSRTLVPVRFVADAFGATVEWDEATQTVGLKMPGKNITIVLGESKFIVNDKEVALDVPATTIEGRTVLPLRAFVESGLGKKVFWDDRGLIVVTDNQLLDPTADADTITKLVNLF